MRIEWDGFYVPAVFDESGVCLERFDADELSRMRHELRQVHQSPFTPSTRLLLSSVRGVCASGGKTVAYQSVIYDFGRVSWLEPQNGRYLADQATFYPDDQSEREIARMLRKLPRDTARRIADHALRQLLIDAVNS